VEKEYSQKEGIDYEETFTDVAKLNRIRILITLSTKHHWMIDEIDMKYSFLNGELKEEMYLMQPKGLVKHGEEHLVCKLREELYGLK